MKDLKTCPECGKESLVRAVDPDTFAPIYKCTECGKSVPCDR